MTFDLKVFKRFQKFLTNTTSSFISAIFWRQICKFLLSVLRVFSDKFLIIIIIIIIKERFNVAFSKYQRHGQAGRTIHVL